MNQNSMLYWWPKVKDLAIPMPKTRIVEVKDFNDLYKLLDGELTEGWTNLVERVDVACEEMGGPPLFLRTDLTSGKHQYDQTCHYTGAQGLALHMGALLEETLMGPDIPPAGYVVREYLELNAPFKAFSGLPIARERRLFVRDGGVLCRHPYWPAEAIQRPTEPGWEDMLKRLNEPLEEEWMIVNDAKLLSERLEGYWSVDFAQAVSGFWYFIDAALGAESWHPEGCPAKVVVDITPATPPAP